MHLVHPGCEHVVGSLATGPGRQVRPDHPAVEIDHDLPRGDQASEGVGSGSHRHAGRECRTAEDVGDGFAPDRTG